MEKNIFFNRRVVFKTVVVCSILISVSSMVPAIHGSIASNNILNGHNTNFKYQSESTLIEPLNSNENATLRF